MNKEELLKAMQNHILQLKALSDKGALIRDELVKLEGEDAKWFEENLHKWLGENGLLKND